MYKENLYAFTLGREWKLSLAELFALFGEKSYHSHSELVAIFHIEKDEKSIIAQFRNIGGSIRVMKIVSETEGKKFPTDVIEIIGKPEGKFHFALGAYGVDFEQSNIGLRIKKTLGENGTSARLINTENKNINAAAWKKEKLGKSQSEYNLLSVPVIASGAKQSRNTDTLDRHAPFHSARDDGKQEKNFYIAITLACQDIDAYAKRDTEKTRDMIVGMMPPKLCQMMINIVSDNGRNGIYDPFCGLGTFLIEGANMGYQKLYGSDISPKMVSSTRTSLEHFIEEEKIWQDRIRKVGGNPAKDFRTLEISLFEQDAEAIASLPEVSILTHANITSEGYLGEIFSSRMIHPDKIQIERKKLVKIYEGFFSGLKRLKFSGNIVMSFPFWSLDENFVYFSEIYEIIEKYGFEIIPLLPSSMKQNTMKGTLLYRRSGQTVGREICKICR